MMNPFTKTVLGPCKMLMLPMLAAVIAAGGVTTGELMFTEPVMVLSTLPLERVATT